MICKDVGRRLTCNPQ